MADEKIEGTEEQEELSYDEQMEQEWDLADKVESGEITEEAVVEETQEEQPQVEEPAEEQQEEVVAQQQEQQPDVETLNNRLTETQRWGHELSAQNKELQEKLAQFEKGQATEEEVSAAQLKTDELKANVKKAKEDIYKDFPEFQALVDPLLNTVSELQQQVVNLSEQTSTGQQQMMQDQALREFETHVKPKVLAEHSDFDQIITSNDYWEWAKHQRPSLRTAAMDSPDPQDINWALTEFKKAMSGGEIDKHKQQQQLNRDKRQTLAQTPQPAGHSLHQTKPRKPGEMNDQEAWDYWEKEDAKNAR